MIFAGVDYSMTSPAICIHNGHEWSFDNCKVFYLTSTPKHQGSFLGGKLQGSLQKEYACEVQRFDQISDWAVKTLFRASPSAVYIEGYSMGSVGRVFNIAENTGLLKHKLYKTGKSFHVVPPTVIKKFATGKGNAKKELLQEAFIEETGVDVKKILGLTEKQWNPSSDIIDAYYICKYGFYNRQEEPVAEPRN